MPSPQQTRQLRLANGLEVLLQVDRTRPRVGIALSYAAGYADDPAGYSGLAHLTEHALFEGSAALKAGDYWLYAERLGATTVNAFTAAEHTTFVTEVPNRSLDAALWLEAERAAFVLEGLDEAGLRRAREAVLDESRARGLRSRERPRLFQLLYGPNHPAARARPDQVRRIGLDHVRWFVQQHYQPTQATLALVGDFDPDRAAEQVRQRFGGWRGARVIPKPKRGRELEQLAHSVQDKQWERVWRRHLSRAWPVRAEGPFTEVVLSILGQVLDESFSDSTLRHVQTWVKDPSANLPGAFVISGVMASGRGFADGKQRIDRAVAELCSGSLSAAAQAAIDDARVRATLARYRYSERAVAMARRPHEASARDPGLLEAFLSELDPKAVANVCRSVLAETPHAELLTDIDRRRLP